ncbi:MAG: type I-C CRISPR-associated protein Cas8c/Csd1 [Bryobacteraceae bacterium]
MLIQALAEYADTRLQDQLNDLAFETKPVPYFLEIGRDGTFLNLVERTEQVQRGKKTVKQPQTLLAPKSPVLRNTGEHPLLACDDMKYVLGDEKKHIAFVDLLKEAAAATSDPALQSCVAFYERPDQVDAARKALADRKTQAGAVIALSTGGPAVARDAVRRYWREHYQKANAARNEKGGEGMCLISGEIGPIAPTHEKIKGLASLGGQPAGVSLMSFDKEAFRSYGWEQNANSPVCPKHAAAYVLALNHLLKRDNASRIDHCGVGFLFWTKKPVEKTPISILEEADPEQVRQLLLLDEGSLHLDPNEFYLLGVSGNGGRLLVRFWIHENLERVRENVAGWFKGLRISSPFTGGIADPPKLWQLLASIARDEPPPDRAIQLIRRAILGQPLGRTILAGALGRLRLASGADKLSPVRAGLIRLCVNDQNGEPKMTEELDPNLNHAAYLCGRLLALYDGLQYQAQGEVNASVSDRYYSLASTYPTLAFPKLTDLGLKHLRKLRRDKPGAAVNIEKEIQEIHTRLAALGAKFPPPLSLEEQGRFAIGYHHQRAESMARAMAKKQERQQNASKEEN